MKEFNFKVMGLHALFLTIICVGCARDRQDPGGIKPESAQGTLPSGRTMVLVSPPSPPSGSTTPSLTQIAPNVTNQRNGITGSITAPAQAGNVVTNGTMDGGGGNVGSLGAASEEETIRAIQLAPSLLRFVLYWHELSTRNSLGAMPQELSQALWRSLGTLVTTPQSRENLQKNLSAAYEKLFPQTGVPAYELLKHLQFVPETKGPCHDTRYQDRDGSAFNANPNEICLSVPRIREKLNRGNLFVEIVALAGHELAHRLGCNEEEATAFQIAVAFTFKMSEVSEIRDLISLRRQRIESSKEPLETFSHGSYLQNESYRRETSLPRFCMSTVSWEKEIEQVIETVVSDGRHRGFMSVPMGRLMNLRSARVQVGALIDYCRERGEGRSTLPRSMIGFLNEDNGNIVEPAGGFIEPIELSRIRRIDLVHLFYLDRGLTGKVRFVPYLNNEAALFNLLEARENFRRMSESYETR